MTIPKTPIDSKVCWASLCYYQRDSYRAGMGKVFTRNLALPKRVKILVEQWTIMDEVSEIRAGWHVDIPPLKKKLLASGHFFTGRYARKFGPAIPAKVKERITADFYRRMHHLVVMMREKLNQQPATSIQQPATSIQHPASSNQHPASSIQHPIINLKWSSTSWITPNTSRTAFMKAP